MAEERIIVDVDDSALDDAIAKAKQLITLSVSATGSSDLTRGIKRTATETLRTQRLLGQMTSDIPRFLDEVGEADLPSVNRELRLILGQSPAMRRLISLYFRIKRDQRAIGIATKEATMLSDILTNPQLILTTIATLILLLKAASTYFARLKRERIAYEEFLRREKGLSKREFDYLRSEVTGGIQGGSGAGARSNYFWSIPG